MIKRILILFFLIPVCCESTKPLEDNSALLRKNKKIEELSKKVDSLFNSSQLPSLQAFIVHRGQTDFKYSKGVRAKGFESPLESNDVFFLGMASKTMTSLAIGQLIDQKLIDWNTTIGDVLGKRKIHPSVKNLTVQTLMSHTSGLAEAEKLKIWPSLYDKKYSVKRARELLVENILASPADFEKGTSPEYNSSGYIILGAMIEQITNFSYEEVVQNKIFNFIGMKSCVFGYYGKEKAGVPMQPWPHESNGNSYVALSSESSKSDFPPAFAAAGNLRCSGEDWIRFLMEMNHGLFRESTLLTEKTYAKIFNTINQKNINLAHFGVSKKMWGGGQVYFNIGAHESAASLSTIVPRREIVLIVFTNAGDKNATRTTNAVLKLLKEFVEDEK